MTYTDGSDGRLHSRPTTPAAGPPAWPTGLHPLAGGLLLVPEEPPAGLLVFFHGAGGASASSLALVRDIPAAHRLLVLLPSSRGRTWDLVLGRTGPDVVALDALLAQVFAVCGVPRVAFGGFSDGGSYALSIGLANGDLAEQVLAFSPGFVAPPGREGRPRVWVSHGTADAVLPVDACGRRVVAQLRQAGYPVTYVEFDGGHVVTPELSGAAVESWLA